MLSKILYPLYVADSAMLPYAHILAEFTHCLYVTQDKPVFCDEPNNHNLSTDPAICYKGCAYLQLAKDGLYIISRQFNPTHIREIYSVLAKRQPQLHKDLLIQALKISSKKNVQVWDLTAGFGVDAGLIASSDCYVTMVEKNPILATILYHALDQGYLPKANLQLVFGDSMAFLQEHRLHSKAHNDDFEIQYNQVVPNIIYVDPMFNDKKNAKSKKSMQLIEMLCMDEISASSEGISTEMPQSNMVDESVELFNLAVSTARDKVVVKRDNKQPSLVVAPKPSYGVQGKTIRYDVYITNNRM